MLWPPKHRGMPPVSTRQTVSWPWTLFPLQQLVSEVVVKQPASGLPGTGAHSTPPSLRIIVGMPHKSPAGRQAVPLVQRLLEQAAFAVTPQQSSTSAQTSP